MQGSAIFQSQGRAETVATPFLMAANNSKVEFFVGDETPLRDDVTTTTTPIGDQGDTMTIALRAAITGHLVLTTLHTNDAPSAFTRMIDMGAEPFLVAASVRGVLAQRLARTVCPRCGVWQDITPAETAMLGLEENGFPIRRGSGCEHCHLGYRGRTGIFEFLPVYDELRSMILTRASSEDLLRRALADGHFTTLRQDGLVKMKLGLTTPEEIVRVTME